MADEIAGIVEKLDAGGMAVALLLMRIVSSATARQRKNILNFARRLTE